MIKFKDLIIEAQKVVLPENIANTVSKMSFGIVNSRNNGRRMTYSKQLSSALKLKGSSEIMIIPIKEQNVIMISTKLPFENAYRCPLTQSEDRFISYASDVVTALTMIFDLPFGARKSLSFNDITLDVTPDNVPVAIIRMENDFIKKYKHLMSGVAEESLQSSDNKDEDSVDEDFEDDAETSTQEAENARM